MSVLKSLKYSYLKIGVHASPPGTLFHFLHKTIFRTYVGLAIVTGYQKRLLLRRGGEWNAELSVTAWRPPQRDARQVRRILLMKLDHIGDFVLGIPAFRLMRDAFAKAEITLLCGAWNKELAERSGLFDRVVRLDVVPEASGKVKGLSLSRETVATLASLPDFDIAVDLKVEDDSREILSRIRARYKAGYESNVGPCDMSLTLPRPQESVWNAPEKEHHTRRLLSMLASAVAADFHMAAATREALAAIAASSGGSSFTLSTALFPIVGIHTGSGTPTKEWPLERFADLAGRLIRETPATVVLFGAPQEAPAAARFAALVNSPRLIDCTGKLKLPEFVAALGQLDLFIGNDTGTTHLAAGMDVPTLCLFSGVSVLGRFAPSLGKNTFVLYTTVPCAPCHLPSLSECPREHMCLSSLTVEGVMKEAIKILDAVRPGVTDKKAWPIRSGSEEPAGLSQDVA